MFTIHSTSHVQENKDFSIHYTLGQVKVSTYRDSFISGGDFTSCYLGHTIYVYVLNTEMSSLLGSTQWSVHYENN